jgi:ketosteroid isomerase-like protein
MTLPVGIEKLHQADVAATLARDVDALTALWDDDGVLLQPGRSPVIGKTAFAEFLKQNLAESASLKVLKYAPEIRDIQVEATSHMNGVFSNQPSGHPISSNQRTSAHDS